MRTVFAARLNDSTAMSWGLCVLVCVCACVFVCECVVCVCVYICVVMHNRFHRNFLTKHNLKINIFTFI